MPIWQIYRLLATLCPAVRTQWSSLLALWQTRRRLRRFARTRYITQNTHHDSINPYYKTVRHYLLTSNSLKTYVEQLTLDTLSKIYTKVLLPSTNEQKLTTNSLTTHPKKV